MHGDFVTTLAERVAVRLKSSLESKGWSQQALVDTTGLTYQTVNAFFNARGKVVNDSLVKIAEALGISLEELFVEERLGELSKELEDKLFAAFERTIARLTAKQEPSDSLKLPAGLGAEDKAILAEIVALVAPMSLEDKGATLFSVQVARETFDEVNAEIAAEAAKKKPKNA